MEFEYIKPEDIEARSMQLIASEMETSPPPEHAAIIRRVIHTTADFEFEHTLRFSEGAVEQVTAMLRDPNESFTIITDTNMVLAGINKKALSRCGGSAVCFMADPKVAAEAKERGITRASVSMEKAVGITGNLIFAIGNAPTALLRLRELADARQIAPKLIIGVPVGFVNVIEAKAMIMNANVPYIVAEGRKGGSTVAAAIVNALLYMVHK